MESTLSPSRSCLRLVVRPRLLPTSTLYQAFCNSSLKRYGHLSTSESDPSSAIKTVININAKGIVVCCESGATTQQIAKFCSGYSFTVLTTTSKCVASQAYVFMKWCEVNVRLAFFGSYWCCCESRHWGLQKQGFCAKIGNPIIVGHDTSPRIGATNRIHTSNMPKDSTLLRAIGHVHACMGNAMLVISIK